MKSIYKKMTSEGRVRSKAQILELGMAKTTTFDHVKQGGWGQAEKNEFDHFGRRETAEGFWPKSQGKTLIFLGVPGNLLSVWDPFVDGNTVHPYIWNTPPKPLDTLLSSRLRHSTPQHQISKLSTAKPEEEVGHRDFRGWGA